MNPEEIAWWKKFVQDERKRRLEWEEMTDEEYQVAGEKYFDLMAMRKSNPELRKNEPLDEGYRKREKELNELIDKKNNFPPVSIHTHKITMETHLRSN